jgi:hypothetical protein
VSSAYKEPKVLGRYQICLQYPEKYFLDPLGYKKDSKSFKYKAKRKVTYYPPVLPIITIKEI